MKKLKLIAVSFISLLVSSFSTTSFASLIVEVHRDGKLVGFLLASAHIGIEGAQFPSHLAQKVLKQVEGALLESGSSYKQARRSEYRLSQSELAIVGSLSRGAAQCIKDFQEGLVVLTGQRLPSGLEKHPTLVAYRLMATANRFTWPKGKELRSFDDQIASLLIETGLPVAFLEDAEDKLQHVINFPDTGPILEATCSALRSKEKLFQLAYLNLQIQTGFVSGDFDLLSKISKQIHLEVFGGSEKSYSYLVDERNKQMVDKALLAFQNRRTPTLIVAGAGHFGGPKGIIRLLTDYGYKVQALKP